MLDFGNSRGVTVIVLIDNYDSFVYNLARYLERLGQKTRVVRNDAVTAEVVNQWQPAGIVLSPGPCAPDQAGCSLEVVAQLAETIPILGVCLGHQTVAQAFGGSVIRAGRPIHGQSTLVEHNATGLFAGLPSPLRVGRYHSLIADAQTLPDCLEVSAWTAEGIVMAIRHRQWPTFGVQFHPESVLTEGGYLLLANFLRTAGCPLPQPLPTTSSELAVPPVVRPLPEKPVTF